MKRWLASIILTVGCFLLVMTASGAWKDAQISSYTGSGSILDRYRGRIELIIDSASGADSSGATFYTGEINTENCKSFYGFLSVSGPYTEAGDDTTDMISDSLIVSLRTVCRSGVTALDFLIKCDTIYQADTLYYNYPSTTVLDTLFKSGAYWKIDIVDSTNAAASARAYPERIYIISAGANVKDN